MGFCNEKKEKQCSPIEWTHKINFECIFPSYTVAIVWFRILFDCFIPSHLKIEIGFKIELKMDWKLLDTCAKIAVFILFLLFFSFRRLFCSTSTTTTTTNRMMLTPKWVDFSIPSRHLSYPSTYHSDVLRYFCTPTPFCC